MLSDSEVEITSGTPKYSSWGKGIFYRKEGGKLVLKSKAVTGLAVTLFLISSTVILLSDEKRGQEVNSIETPRNAGEGNQSVLLEEATRSVEKEKFKEELKVQKTTTFKRRPIAIARLGLVSREDLNKIPPGSEGKARLLTGGTNGLVKAKLIEPLVAFGVEYFPAGTTLIGQGNSTEERLLIQFTKLIIPNGSSINIQAQAYDAEDKILGLNGSKVGRVSAKLVASAGLSFIGGMAQGLQETEVRDGVAFKKNDIKNSLINGVSQASLEQSKEMMENFKEKQSIIEVKPGTEIMVVFDGQ